MSSEWVKWDYRKAKSSIMRNATLEERGVGYKRKTWGEEWYHHLDDPEIRLHVARRAEHRHIRVDPAEFFGVLFATGNLEGEFYSCDCSRAANQLLASLRQSARSLPRPSLRIPEPSPQVRVTVAPKRRMLPPNPSPPLRQQLTTLGQPRLPSFLWSCSGV